MNLPITTKEFYTVDCGDYVEVFVKQHEVGDQPNRVQMPSWAEKGPFDEPIPVARYSSPLPEVAQAVSIIRSTYAGEGPELKFGDLRDMVRRLREELGLQQHGYAWQ